MRFLITPDEKGGYTHEKIPDFYTYKSLDGNGKELLNSIPLPDPTILGRGFMVKCLNENEIAAAVESYKSLNKTPDYMLARQASYIERGATINALVVAMVEASEGRPEALNALKVIRAEIKTAIPKVL